nr:amino acid adenylation domain-containing protein [uncultured Butyrivibrio sp.]
MNNVLDYLSDTVKKYPDKPAFVDAGVSLSFSELKSAIDSIGTALLQEGCRKEPIIVFMDKSAKEIAAFFGVIASGCYYVPIDSEMPAMRIQKIIDNCNPKVCIADEKNLDAASKLNFKGKVFTYDELAGREPDAAALQKVHDETIDIDPIYIVFTSGSTGIPKGVAACHRSVIDYIEQLSKVLEVSEKTVFGNQAPLYFDACLKELYPTIKFGATTYLIPKELFSMPLKLVEYLNEKKINTICWVVSALTIISAFKTFKKLVPEHLKVVAFGSEVFAIKQYNLWKEACPNAKFINLYGPTEATGMSCFYVVDKEFSEGDVIPIGRPFENTQVLLLKEDGTLAEKGEEGEIYLRGTCVTLGYYNDPERTAGSFVQNPLQKSFPEIVYRTGDIARYNDEGNLLFVSRRDNQIKHMGHRIELGEIEAGVAQIDGISLTGCIYDDKKEKIVLYYTGEIAEAEVINGLKNLLPRYMLPNKVYRLEEMLFTPNGKIDRKSLKQKYYDEQ